MSRDNSRAADHHLGQSPSVTSPAVVGMDVDIAMGVLEILFGVHVGSSHARQLLSFIEEPLR